MSVEGKDFSLIVEIESVLVKGGFVSDSDAGSQEVEDDEQNVDFFPGIWENLHQADDTISTVGDGRGVILGGRVNPGSICPSGGRNPQK